MTKIISVYDSILRYSGLESDSKGFINARIGDRKEPTSIDGKQLVLPTREQLSSFNPEEKMVFHPLSENILRGESQVLMKLKHAINVKLNYSIGILAKSLLNVVASPSFHAKLTPDQSDILVAIKEADEKSVVNLVNMMVSGVKNKPDKLFTNIYLKRGGTIDGKRYSRVGIVSFPFYDDLVNDRIEKIRVKDKETYRQLFEYIFPDIGKPEAYNYGTQTQVAPFLDALMRTSLAISSKINDLVLLFENFIDEPDVIKFDSDWIEYFNDLDALVPDIRRIPIQQGNDGSISITEQQEETQRVVQPQQPTVYQPQPQQQAPVYQQPQPVMNQFVQQQPMAQQPQQVSQRGNGRTLDWKSLAASSPAIAYSTAPNPLSNQLMQQNMQQNMMGYGHPQGMMPSPMMNQMPQHGQQVMTPNGPAIALHTPQGVALQYANGVVVPFNVGMMPQQPNPMSAGYSPSTTGFGYNR